MEDGQIQVVQGEKKGDASVTGVSQLNDPLTNLEIGP